MTVSGRGVSPLMNDTVTSSNGVRLETRTRASFTTGSVSSRSVHDYARPWARRSRVLSQTLSRGRTRRPGRPREAVHEERAVVSWRRHGGAPPSHVSLLARARSGEGSDDPRRAGGDRQRALRDRMVRPPLGRHRATRTTSLGFGKERRRLARLPRSTLAGLGARRLARGQGAGTDRARHTRDAAQASRVGERRRLLGAPHRAF